MLEIEENLLPLLCLFVGRQIMCMKIIYVSILQPVCVYLPSHPSRLLFVYINYDKVGFMDLGIMSNYYLDR